MGGNGTLDPAMLRAGGAMTREGTKFQKGLRILGLVRQARAQINAARAQGKDGPPVLVVMRAQMGDVVMGLGVAAVLRAERHLKSPLLFGCQPQWQGLAIHDPVLDGTLAVQTLAEVRVLARLFPVIYVLDIPIPNLLHALDGVASVFRYGQPTTADWFTHGWHLIDLYAQNAGMGRGTVTPRVFLRDADKPSLPPFDGITLALHTHSSMAAKNWPASRFAELVARHPSVRFVLMGAAGEGGELGSLPNVVNLTGHLTLTQTAAAIASCDLFVGPDSGPAYMAWAVGTRTLTLFGATVPETSGPCGPGHVGVRAPGACVPACHRACVHTPLCINSLTVDAVSEALAHGLSK